MRARAVCLPIGKPLSLHRIAVFVVLLLAALLLLSCTDSDTATGQQMLSKPAVQADYAYSYSDSVPTEPLFSSYRKSSVSTDSPICSIDELRKATNSPTQVFTIRNKRDTVIAGNKGVKVHIPSDCFELKNPNTEVKIILKEYNSNADFFFANLTTSSNGQMLESGGTIYINAMANGLPVKMKQGKEIALAFPSGKPAPDMQTFYGEQAADGSMNWQPATTANTGSWNSSYYLNLFNPYRINYTTEKVVKTKLMQRTSTYTSQLYQLQAYGSNDHCTRFADSSSYKNILEYLSDNFTVSAEEFKFLQGSFFVYFYKFNQHGNITDEPELRLEFHTKPGVFSGNKKLRKETVAMIKNRIVALLKDAPKAEPSNYLKNEVLRVYINDFTVAKITGPTLVINDNKVKKEYTELKCTADTTTLRKYWAYQDSVNRLVNAKHDSLMANNADYYFMNSSKLGWINCDRFYENGKPKGEIIVDAGDNKNLTVKVIFKNIKSLMALYNKGDGEYVTSNIPMGESVRYIVVDKRPDGLYYAVKDAVTSKQKVSGFTYVPMTMDAIKKELASL
jgi:hypothetical protein